MMKSVLIFCVLLLISVVNAWSQTGIINGFISDRELGTPVAGVMVRVDGTQIGAVSGTDGRFRLKGLSAGTLILRFSSIGYEKSSTMVVFRTTEPKDIVVTLLQSPLETDQVVVSANRRVQAAQDVPISVSTLTSADLDSRAITKLDDALKYVSGVTVQGDQVNIRGASGFALGIGSRTAVLLDGMPLLSGDNGDIKFDVLPVADVDRIEIIKGAGSALYGTGALGGVVSMFTKPPAKKLELSARSYMGVYEFPKYDSWKYRNTVPTQSGADLRVAQSVGDFSFSASGGVRYDEGSREFDKHLRGFGYGKAVWQPTYQNSFTVATLVAVENSQNFIYWRNLTNATLPPLEQNLDERLYTTRFALSGEWLYLFSDKTSLTVRPATYRTTFENRVNGVALESNKSTAYSHNVDVQVTSVIVPTITLTSGITGKLNHVRSDLYGFQLQSIISAFAQAEVTELKYWVFTAGLRVDREETYTLKPQLELSPKFGASYKFSDFLNFRASLGRGFRAATVAERYANIRYGPFNVIPNPNILPESSWSAEIGAHITVTNWLLPIDVDVAVFDNELRNLIEPEFAVDQASVPIVFKNVTQARIIGAELTIRTLVAKNIRFETGLTLMAPKDIGLDRELKYRNAVLWYNRASWQVFDGVDVQADYRYVSKITTTDAQLQLFIPDADQRVPAHIVDARLIFDFASFLNVPMRFSIIGRNVMNYAYTEYVANLGPSRNFMLQLEYRK
ncbi:MAG: TonB-dependent receptor [Ignavibacteria bacterium]|nr:TonB-dependent receptor [Ignavibacteria bacterium]